MLESKLVTTAQDRRGNGKYIGVDYEHSQTDTRTF